MNLAEVLRDMSLEEWKKTGRDTKRSRQLAEAADLLEDLDSLHDQIEGFWDGIHEEWFSLRQHLEAQREFSAEAFGPGPRVAGILDHITKEIEEVRQKPGDLEEWIDLVLLSFDGALRTGATSDDICEALEAKLEKNMQREWPDWRTSDPTKAIEHKR